jgi:hypothetical protein
VAFSSNLTKLKPHAALHGSVGQNRIALLAAPQGCNAASFGDGASLHPAAHEG